MTWKRKGPPRIDPRARFWSKVDTQGQAPDACWLWMGSRSPQGYGQWSEIWGTTLQTHRYAYEHLVGPIPNGLQIDHLCRNTSCCNPTHLEPVTRSENVRRAAKHRPRPTHCPQGHPYDEANTYFVRRKDGGLTRRCRTCHRDRARRDQARLRRKRGALVRTRRRTPAEAGVAV